MAASSTLQRENELLVQIAQMAQAATANAAQMAQLLATNAELTAQVAKLNDRISELLAVARRRDRSRGAVRCQTEPKAERVTF